MIHKKEWQLEVIPVILWKTTMSRPVLLENNGRYIYKIPMNLITDDGV